jgi:beta-phosphoglucomutase-like phosphatase (HAD superfamily)
VLEDAPSGIESARAAGITVVAFRASHPDDELERATLVLDSLAEAAARLLPIE